MRKRDFIVAVANVMAGLFLVSEASAQPPSLLHSLSDFGGVAPYSAVARMCADRERDEVYVLESNEVHVYNATGMEVYWFGYDPSLGSLRDVAAGPSGDLYLLSNPTGGTDDRTFFIARCNYRGELLGRIEMTGAPAALRAFAPNYLALSRGRFVLASGTQLLAAEFDSEGRFERQWDLAEIAGLSEKDRGNVDLGGFSVDGDGNLLFTIPVAFKAYVAAPDGTARAFGRPGSGPGMFGIVGGIVRGDDGKIWVADRLRSVVMAFGSELQLVTEISGDPHGSRILAGPANVLVGAGGKLYVTQTRGRGISVFATRPS
jgi:hypothetical protein